MNDKQRERIAQFAEFLEWSTRDLQGDLRVMSEADVAVRWEEVHPAGQTRLAKADAVVTRYQCHLIIDLLRRNCDVKPLCHLGLQWA